jgi:hypothetical protein
MAMIGKPFFVNMDILQFGSFQDTYESGGKGYLRFRPINSMVKVIEIPDVNIDTDNLVTIPRMSKEGGTYPETKVLLSGTHGSSRFLEEELGYKLPEVLRKIKEQRENIASERAAIKTKERIYGRGDKAIIQDLAKKQSIIETGRRPSEEDRKKIRRSFFE